MSTPQFIETIQPGDDVIYTVAGQAYRAKVTSVTSKQITLNVNGEEKRVKAKNALEQIQQPGYEWNKPTRITSLKATLGFKLKEVMDNLPDDLEKLEALSRYIDTFRRF